jgi:hypothetical protein
VTDQGAARPRGRLHAPDGRVLGRVALTAILVLLGLKVLAYVRPGTVGIGRGLALVRHVEHGVTNWYANAPFLHSCPPGRRKLTIAGSWLCVPPEAPATAYTRIYETYPADSGGLAQVYHSTGNGTMSAADDLMRGVFDLARFEPVLIGATPTWRENPYNSRYWRFEFYALRPTADLLYALEHTGNAAYGRRLLAILDSFVARERSSPFAWQDNHAVAFRAMVLVDEWWALRRRHLLSLDQSTLLLRELERTGRFLADPNHYEPGHNHGTNEGAALLQLGVAFPGLPHAYEWRETARYRLAESIRNLVDADGSLIENSPYYDFYTLDKYWQIGAFARRAGLEITPDFQARITSMVNFATYLLQPDSSVPLLGASLQGSINDSGSFAQMAAEHPSFRYVLTHGAEGRRPVRTSAFFPASGQTIMRSGWGRGSSFLRQTYLTFNVGAYRTRHSNLDALAITLFGGGIPLLQGAGLFSYNPGPMRRYFHGTVSHDTVVVDGGDQKQGAVTPGRFFTDGHITYQTGESSLYDGVTHRRLVLMLDPHHVLVVDRLDSEKRHVYSQMWHFFPGAHVSTAGLSVSGAGATPQQSITITQLVPGRIRRSIVSGRRDPPAGLCSLTYQHAIPCPQVAYTIRGRRDAAFTTLLTIGAPTPDFHATVERAGSVLAIRDGSRAITIRLRDSTSGTEVAYATHPRAPALRGEQPIPGTEEAANWSASGDGALSAIPGQAAGEELVTTGHTEAMLTDSAVSADLSKTNLLLRVRLRGVPRLRTFRLELSNDHWTTTTAMELGDSYSYRYDGEWMRLSLGEGALLQDADGHWWTTGSGPFDWSRVDGVRFVVETHPDDPPATLDVAYVDTIPRQKTGVVVIVFDDGYRSILPAARYMHEHGIPGDVAVIGKYTVLPARLYLNTDQLRVLQNRWGWNMVNHTQQHVDAIVSYRYPLRLGTYERDIVQGAMFLEGAGLNSAPNWLIYPHGSTDAALSRVVRRLYKFARTTDNAPDAYPFGDPLRVKTLEVRVPQDSGDGGTSVTTTPAQVHAAVVDAQRFHQTLILTFHRIHSLPSDRPGYPLRSFEKVIDDLQATGIPVRTLSGLDRMLGVPENNRIVDVPGRASQIVVSVSVSTHSSRGLLQRIFSWF